MSKSTRVKCNTYVGRLNDGQCYNFMRKIQLGALFEFMSKNADDHAIITIKQLKYQSKLKSKSKPLRIVYSLEGSG